MTKINLKPTAGNLLIEPLDKETKTASGIYLPDNAGEKPSKGKVLAVGDNEVTDSGKEVKSPVKVGDVVFYKKWDGNEIKIAGKEYLLVPFKGVLAVETK